MTRAEFEDQLLERAKRVLGSFVDVPPELEDEFAAFDPDDVLSADEQWDLFRILSPQFVGCGPDDGASHGLCPATTASTPSEQLPGPVS